VVVWLHAFHKLDQKELRRFRLAVLGTMNFSAQAYPVAHDGRAAELSGSIHSRV
jgi:hypothetical protein